MRIFAYPGLCSPASSWVGVSTGLSRTGEDDSATLFRQVYNRHRGGGFGCLGEGLNPSPSPLRLARYEFSLTMPGGHCASARST
jgi:hypothetical protein